jgi:Rrf2 family protein
MFSKTCKYGLRAVIYIASQPKVKDKTGIKQISKDLNLPTPFLAKILQQLAKQKILGSTKGPHGGFSLLKDPKKITLLDIVKTIDGEEIFTNCIIHDRTCKNADKHKETCPLHDDYSKIRADLVKMFESTTIEDLVTKQDEGKKFMI